MVTQIQKFITSQGTLCDTLEAANKKDVSERFYNAIKKFAEEEKYPDPVMLALWLSNDNAIASQLLMILFDWKTDREKNRV